MDQLQVGKFIQKLRKDKELTQKELAEMICISDKTISKWENGISMPDTSMLEPLCSVLNISVNELLSCEKLPPEDYSKKAEENMMNLLKENESEKKSSTIMTIIGSILGIVSIVLLFMSMMGTSFSAVAWFIDLPSIIFLVIICVSCVFLSGARSKRDIFAVIQKSILPASGFEFFFTIIIILGNITGLEQLGPRLAVAILTPMYAFLVYLILIPICKRLEK